MALILGQYECKNKVEGAQGPTHVEHSLRVGATGASFKTSWHQPERSVKPSRISVSSPENSKKKKEKKKFHAFQVQKRFIFLLSNSAPLYTGSVRARSSYLWKAELA